MTFGDVQINGVTVPAMLEPTRAAVAPPLLSGHDVDAKNQIVLGPATLADLHKKVDDRVTLSYDLRSD